MRTALSVVETHGFKATDWGLPVAVPKLFYLFVTSKIRERLIKVSVILDPSLPHMLNE